MQELWINNIVMKKWIQGQRPTWKIRRDGSCEEHRPRAELSPSSPKKPNFLWYLLQSLPYTRKHSSQHTLLSASPARRARAHTHVIYNWSLIWFQCLFINYNSIQNGSHLDHTSRRWCLCTLLFIGTRNYIYLYIFI